MRPPDGRERSRPTTLPTISSIDCHSVSSAPPPADRRTSCKVFSVTAVR
jgi:hypothetical protein